MGLRYIKILFFIILIITFNISYDGIKYMNIIELITFNLQLYLILKSGLFDITKKGTNLLTTFTNDQILIKNHRKLQKKYGKVVTTFVLKYKHHYILDSEIVKNILFDSPKLFDAGNLKKSFFDFMPLNVGISGCNSQSNCPWKKRRIFNENVLGTKKINDFFNYIPTIVSKSINKPLLNISDFKDVALNMLSYTMYGLNTENGEMLKDYVINKGDTNFLNSKLYNQYSNNLTSSYMNTPKSGLLYYANIYKNDSKNVIDDQIPHWFLPFYLLFNYNTEFSVCYLKF